MTVGGYLQALAVPPNNHLLAVAHRGSFRCLRPGDSTMPLRRLRRRNWLLALLEYPAFAIQIGALRLLIATGALLARIFVASGHQLTGFKPRPWRFRRPGPRCRCARSVLANCVEIDLGGVRDLTAPAGDGDHPGCSASAAFCCASCAYAPLATRHCSASARTAPAGRAYKD